MGKCVWCWWDVAGSEGINIKSIVRSQGWTLDNLLIMGSHVVCIFKHVAGITFGVDWDFGPSWLGFTGEVLHLHKPLLICALNLFISNYLLGTLGFKVCFLISLFRFYLSCLTLDFLRTTIERNLFIFISSKIIFPILLYVLVTLVTLISINVIHFSLQHSSRSIKDGPLRSTNIWWISWENSHRSFWSIEFSSSEQSKAN